MLSPAAESDDLVIARRATTPRTGLSPVEAGIQPTRVLLVDDDEGTAVIVRAILADDGIEVDWAADHGAAIEAIRDHSYAALLIDYHLGATDGVRLMHDLQVRGYDAPMLMLTDSCDTIGDPAAIRSGAANFLSKGDLSGPGLSRAVRYARERHDDLSDARLVADSTHDEASTDSLTRLGNRRAFDLDLQRLVDGHGTGGVLTIVLDGLNAINDSVGHAAGDLAIRAIAERTRQTIRAGDAAYRIGGDRIAVITWAPGVVGFGRRLAVVQSRVLGPDCLLTASVGWAQLERDDTPATLLHRADQLLNANKQSRGSAGAR